MDADPVPVLSHTVPAALDLTECDLRAAAPVHLEYLRNMGVKASFSASITVQGKLWGLIACHHTEPRTLSYHARRLTYFISRGFVMRLLAVQAKERMKLTDSIDHAMEELTRRLVTASKDAPDINEITDSLKELVQADYTVFISDHGIQKFDCPFSNDELLFIDEWYMGMNEDLLFTDQIHYMIPWLKISPENCSGLLAVRTPYRYEDGSNKWLRFYWIRKEFPHHVKWAGEPVKEESVDSETGVPYLSPRRSFAEWKELKRGFSRPWSTADLLTARKFRGSLLHWLRTR